MPMLNNDVLRGLRDILKTDDTTLASITKLGGVEVSSDEIASYVSAKDAPGHTTCPHRVIASFLDGLIQHRRGRQENAPPAPLDKNVSSNVVLKKLRVAFELKEADLIEMMADTECPVTKPELGALFRSPTHKHFRLASEGFVRCFLDALAARSRS